MNKVVNAEIVITVPFYDLDPMQIVWHGNYVKYFEKVRCELLSKINYGYEEMERSGYMWPVVDMRLKYVNSAQFGQRLLCQAKVVEFENRLKIEYLIVCQKTGLKLTKGYTIQVAVDLNSRDMLFVSPPVLLERLGVNDE
ncbi:acyl-CoA thioesterase [Aliikangiella sp. IMCC44359]|uniref:acyl-CoA thioesterase n=1 Tax=Aliikangiella sp. IMCC44359 TaxID=3459125 RepID=UPI00403A9BB4